MKFLDNQSLKKAFTFLEIIVVLLIMTLVYNLATTSFSKNSLTDSSIHFNMKYFLQNSLKIYDKKIELLVLDDKVILRVDDNKASDETFELPEDIEFYTYEQNGDEKEYFGFFYENGTFKEIQFRYVIYPNGSSTKCIIFKDDMYHIQSNYFRDTSTFDDIYKAIEYLRHMDIKNGAIVVDE